MGDDDTTDGADQATPTGTGSTGVEIVEAVVLVRLIKSDLKVASEHYDPLFKQLGYDFYTDVAMLYTDFAAAIAKGVVNSTKAFVEQDLPANEGTIILSFELYFILQQLVAEALGREGMPPEMAISDFYRWFQPIIKNWMFLARTNGEKWISRAVEHDEIAHTVTDDVMYSASVIDLFTMIAQVMDFYSNLKTDTWPRDSCLDYNAMMIDMICHMARLYSRQIGDKLEENSFFDVDGQFDVSQQVCTTLNNIQSAILKLDASVEQFDMESIEAHHRKLFADGLAEYAESTLTVLLADCRSKMQAHVDQYSKHLVDKTGNEIRRLLNEAIDSAAGTDMLSEELASPLLDYLEVIFMAHLSASWHTNLWRCIAFVCASLFRSCVPVFATC